MSLEKQKKFLHLNFGFIFSVLFVSPAAIKSFLSFIFLIFNFFLCVLCALCGEDL